MDRRDGHCTESRCTESLPLLDADEDVGRAVVLAGPRDAPAGPDGQGFRLAAVERARTAQREARELEEWQQYVRRRRGEKERANQSRLNAAVG